MKRKSANSTINLSSEKLLEKYSDTTLKCDPCHFRRSGLDLKNSYIKIDKHYLSVVPYSMSMGISRFLVSMNENEINLFESFKEETQSLNLTFDSDIFGRTVEFLLWGQAIEIRQANPVLNVALISFKIGCIVGEEDSSEVEDYHFLDVETDFNPYLAEIMSPFLDGRRPYQ